MSKNERKLIRLETVAVVFGWPLLMGMSAKDIAVAIDSVLSADTPREMQDRQLMDMVCVTVGYKKRDGNMRQYMKTRVDYRQLHDDIESIRLVWSMA